MVGTENEKTKAQVQKEVMNMGQNERVLRHLKSYAGITTLTAYEKYGVTRLSARIWDLRNNGYDIVSVPKQVVNRFGERCDVVEYRLKK